MNKLLFAAMTAFGRVFLVTFLLAATGILSAPDQPTAVALSFAALIASIVAGLRAIMVFIPQISWAGVFPQPIAAWVDAFTLAFLATFVTLLSGWLASPEYTTWKSAVTAIFIGALTAGVRALQGLVTAGDSPSPAIGK
jgi:hypothetical protein